MFSLEKRCLAFLLPALALLAVNPLPARAQMSNSMMRPGMMPQSMNNAGLLGRLNLPISAFGANPFVANALLGNAALNAAAYSNAYGNTGVLAGAYASGSGLDPYSSLNPYSSGYGSGYGNSYPEGSYLYGSAEVTKAQGRFLVNQMEALQTLEKVRAERIAVRRKLFEAYQYERQHTPTPAEERERFQLQQLLYSRSNPANTEIWSGKALNVLLADLKKLQAGGKVATLRTFALALDEDALKDINLTVGIGNMGLLKRNPRLSWPAALSGPEFKSLQERTGALAAEAIQQAAMNGTVDRVTLSELSRSVTDLRKHLRSRGGDLAPALYIEGKTFLNQLDDAVTALQQRDAGSHFNGTYALKARTVPELVKHLSEQGLQFAPAVTGGEAAYLALHQALVEYDLAAQPVSAKR